MAASKETVDTILNFYPCGEDGRSVKVLQHVDLGEFDEGKRLGFGPCVYERRVTVVEGEPFTGHITRQPALYVVEGSEVTIFAYRADVEAAEALAERVVDHIKIIEARQRV
ncbi:MAG: hypothetical protein CEO21_158 [Microgenomates group bacterium Gr01-1014_80]|nr:MAG: hypothetical protein CEO21_158 [Microgenomates group bacterium Gr01-1014_80]